MSSAFPSRPKTTKGAIIALRPDSKDEIMDSNIPAFIFQYNPENLTRTISSPNGEGISLEEEKKRVINSIAELINLSLELDANDKLEQSNQQIDYVKNGLHPALAALESIMHSQSKTENSTPTVALFIWGPNRIVPVWLDSLKITEETFDPNLNPIRVRIELNMRVLDLSELRIDSSEYAICASYLDHRRMFARLYSENEINREFFVQILGNIQQYLAIGKSKS